MAGVNARQSSDIPKDDVPAQISDDSHRSPISPAVTSKGYAKLSSCGTVAGAAKVRTDKRSITVIGSAHEHF